MTASYAKLRDGTWGIRTTGKVRAGDVVTVTKRDGTSKTETVGAVLWEEDGACLCTIATSSAKPRKSGSGCPMCGRNRRLVYDHEDGIRKCYECCDMPG